jgi:hypothetical protein
MFSITSLVICLLLESILVVYFKRNPSSANSAKSLKCAVTDLTRIGNRTLVITISIYTASSTTFTATNELLQ